MWNMEGRYKVIVYLLKPLNNHAKDLPSTPKRKKGKNIYKVEADSKNTKQKQ